MYRRPRKLVVRYEKQKQPPPFETWADTDVAVLECGHVQVVTATHMKRVACVACPGGREVGSTLDRDALA